MRKNKLFTFIITGAMCISLAACGNNNQDATQAPTVTDASTTQETTVAESVYRDDLTVAEVEAAVAEALGDNYWANTALESIADLGITEDMYTEYLYKLPMISVNIDTLIIVKAAEGKVADVEAKLNEFRDNNINDTMQYPMNLAKVQCSQVVSVGNYVAFVQLGADTGNDAIAAAGNVSEDEMAKLEMDAITEQNDQAVAAITQALTK